MNSAIHRNNRETLKKLFKAFIDNPSDKTVASIYFSHQHGCWLAATGIAYGRCPSTCPAADVTNIKERHTYTPLCNSYQFFRVWKIKPAKALLFAIQFLAFLESHEGAKL
jgi:hypothetical protein